LHGITATALELLETLSPADKAARECCQLIAECGRLMRSLIEDILDFEQIESNRLMLDKLPFDVVHEVERAVRVLAGAAAKKNIELDVSTAGVTLPLHVGDPLRFRQIVFNLLSNAIKFTPDGGRIRVSATSSDAKPEEINVEVADNGIGIGADHLPYLFVGFSQEDNSARRRNGGTGLGLAISKSLCEAMSGSIGCRSAPGQGSTFHFTVVLPVAVPTAAEAPTTSAIPTPTTSATTSADSSAAAVDAVQPTIQQESSSSTPSPPVSAPNSPNINAASLPSRTQTNGNGFRPLSCSSTFIPSPLTVAPSKSPVIESSFNGVRVLLVEDNLVNQKVGVRMLASLGCSVQVAVNGEECLRILEAAEARGRDSDDGHDDDESTNNNDSNHHSECDRGFDAVLMDCQMPVMDGFQATSLIRERERKHAPARRPLPVIALTASATKEYREQCFLSGMNDWLAKPFTKANLAHMLRKWARPELASEDGNQLSATSNIPHIFNASAPADICT
jgi:CheY-like chemotaxis protein